MKLGRRAIKSLGRLVLLAGVLLLLPASSAHAQTAAAVPEGPPAEDNTPLPAPPVITEEKPAATVSALPSVPGEAASPAEAPQTLPPPRLVYKRRYNLAILGGGLLIATWGADRLLTQGYPASLNWLPWLPLVGPWYLLYGQTQIAAPNTGAIVLLVTDGLLQASGLTLGILGFALHKKRMVMSLPEPPASGK